MRILAIDASFGASHADSTVFELSNIGKRIMRDNLLGEYYILGDNGYITYNFITLQQLI